MFERTPIPRAVMKLSVPMILGALTVIGYNMSGTFFVGMNTLFPLYGLAYAQFVAELVPAGISMLALKRLFRRMEANKTV